MRYGGVHFRPATGNRPRPRPRPITQRAYRYTGRSPDDQNEYYRFSCEARQAPASNDTCYVFPWNEDKECYEVAANFDKQKAEGRIDELMINDLFRDIHTMRLWAPKVGDPLMGFAIVLFIISIPLFFGYLFSGLFTNYYKYEILEDDDKRYIEKTPESGRFVEIPLTSLTVMVIGIVMGVVLMGLVNKREYVRVRRRAFILKKIVEKHQQTTFEGSRCTVTSSELGAYIKIGFNWKAPEPAAPPPPGSEQAQVLPQEGVAAGSTVISDVPFNTIEIKNKPTQEKTEVPKTPLITEHPEDVRLQIPEEQPL